MYPFNTEQKDKHIEQPTNELEDSLISSEAIQGDVALISRIKELNDLRAQKTQ